MRVHEESGRARLREREGVEGDEKKGVEGEIEEDRVRERNT